MKNSTTRLVDPFPKQVINSIGGLPAPKIVSNPDIFSHKFYRNSTTAVLRSLTVLSFFLFFQLGNTFSQCTSGCGQTASTNVAPGTNNFSNTFCITTSTTLTYNQNFDMNGGTTCVGPNVTFSSGGGNWNGNWTVNNYGTFTKSITLNSNQVFYNYGNFTGSVSLNGGTIVNLSGATFTPSSFNFNSGSFTNNAGGTATFGAAVTVNSGATFVNNGTMSIAGLTLNSSAAATLGGTTTINGSITNNGNISIGGLINVTGSYFQNGSGVMASLNTSQCNALNVSGSIQGQGTYNGSNGLLLNKTLTSPTCGSCLINGASATPAGQPLNQIAAPVLTSSANTISGTITNPGGTPAATNYIVLRRFGAAVTDLPVNYINYTVGSTIGNSTVVAVNAIGTLNFSDANVIAANGCGTYYYAAFAFNTAGICGTYNKTLNVGNIVVTGNGGTVSSNATVCSGNTSGSLLLSGYTGSIIRWEYAVNPFSSWTSIANTTNAYTSGALTQTTEFRAVINAGTGCSNANSAIATTTVNALPSAPTSTNATLCGTGTVTLSASPGTGETIDWYAAASGGTALATGTNSYTTPSLSATTTYYAAARNTISGCVSATRTAVTATINPSPSLTLANFTPICSGTSSVSLAYSSLVNAPDQYAINWSTAAVAAGMTNVSWTALSGGVIPVNSLISTAGNYAASILVRNSTTGCQTDVSNGAMVSCATAVENSSITMTAPSSGIFTSINFASYGTPTGSCGSFGLGACNAVNSQTIVQTAALGNNSFTITANNATFGDPCVGTGKSLYIQATATAQVLKIYAIPTISASSGASSCGTASLTLSATASAGAAIDWYAAASGGTALTTGSNTYTTATLSASTTFYAQARNTVAGCLSVSRTAVIASINNVPAAPAGTNASLCGTGTLTLSAIPGTGETIDWYAAASGGTALATGTNSYTTPSLSATTTYYAAARNISSGCVSTTRTAVTATVNPIPSLTLANFTPICAGTNSVTLAYSSLVNAPDQYAINWSTAAVAAGMTNVGWTALSGGVIPVNSLVSTAGNYTASILVRNSATGCQTDVSNGATVSCATAVENSSITMTAPSSGLFTVINFASYGTPTGSCGSFALGACNAVNSQTIVQTAALGNNSFTITANNATFGDPCVGTGKSLYIQATSTAQVLTIYATPTVIATAGAGSCGTGSVTLSATPSASAAIDWYAAATGGTALATGSNTFTTPTLSATTTYYAQARNTVAGCLSVARTAVTASINAAPTAPTGTNASLCGTGTVTLSATPGSGETIDWYAAATGGAALATGMNSFTTPSLSTTTTYYAAARNSSSGCVSATRTAVTATINPAPSLTLANFTPVCSGTSSVSLAYSSPVNAPDQYAINWSTAAVAAGMTNVGWTALSGGVIPVNSLVAIAGNYTASIVVRNSTTGCQTDVSNGAAVSCATAAENSSITMTAPSGGIFTVINFASYGTPTGSCGSFAIGACNAVNSQTIVQTAALGNNSFTIGANNATFGDPCSGTTKRLYIQATSTAQVLTIYAAPTVSTSLGATRCGTGTLSLSATPSAGAVIDWYAAASGGTALATATNSFTTPSIATTTVYYAGARINSTGCVSLARTAVSATVTVPTISSFSPVNAGTGTSVVITGTNFTGATAVSFGGTAATSFTVNSATQITAVVASGSTGSVSVTTACGTGTKTGFTYFAAPTISSFTPTSAFIGNMVTITGTNFTGATAVSFGGTAASLFTVVSSTSIIAYLGSGATGVVSVTTPGGTATKTGFTYISATIWTGTLDNNWNNSGNWNNGTPAVGSLVFIPQVETYPTLSSSTSINALSMDSNASLIITGTNTLSISTSFTNNGTVSGAGTIVMNGSAAQTIDGTGTVNNININNASGCNISSGTNNMSVTGTLTPTAGVLTTNGNLTLISNAAGTARVASGAASGNYLSGTVSFQRFIPARRAWRMVSFPFISTGAPTINASIQEAAGGTTANPNPGFGTHITGGTSANGFDQNPSGNASILKLSGSSWVGIGTTNQAITNQPGYFLFVRGSRANILSQGTGAIADNTTLRGTGTLKQGTQNISISGTGWKMVGNPFPSAIDLSAVANSNASLINNNFKFWDPKMGGSNNVGGYVTASYNGSSYDYAPTATSSISQFAQSAAVFFVDAKATGTLSINESNKSASGSDNVFRPVAGIPQPKLHINLHSINANGNTPIVDGVMVGYGADFKNDIDHFDATKLTTGNVESIAILRDSVKLSIERRQPFDKMDTIDLNLASMARRGYQFEFNFSDFDTTHTQAWLEDRATDSLTPLNMNQASTYNFVINSGYDPNRYRVIFKNNTPVRLIPLTKISAAQLNKEVAVQWEVENQVNISNYEIQRSGNGADFSSVYKTPALENNGTTALYHWLDQTPQDGMNMYRIKINSQDGQFSYSSIANVLFNNNTSIGIYPNPVVNNTYYLRLAGQLTGKYQLITYNNNGQQVSITSLMHLEATPYEKIQINKTLPCGIYKIEVKNPAGVITPINMIIE